LRDKVMPVGVRGSTLQTEAVPAPPATTERESGVNARESTLPPCTATHVRATSHVAVSQTTTRPLSEPPASHLPSGEKLRGVTARFSPPGGTSAVSRAPVAVSPTSTPPPLTP